MRKEVFFKLIVASIPFILLVIIELGLRIVGYGESYDLFEEINVGDGKEYLIMNSSVARKYFPDNGYQSDNLADLFLKSKTDSTFRIIIQGASTVVGFPYYHSGCFSRLLEHRLALSFPEKNIEVINTGLTAVNSFTLSDLSNEVLEQNPDLIIIYAGHNEYYGALGVGSTSSLGSNSSLIRFFLAVKHYRVVQLALNLTSKIMKRNNQKAKIGETTLMEVMVENQKIHLNSPEYLAGLKQFEDNLSRMLKKYKKHNVPVILCTIVSNERDIQPFISEVHVDEFQFRSEVESGIGNASKLANNSASTSYWLGQYYLESNLDSAKKYLHKAKELDLLRFRAPKKINEIICQLANEYQSNLVDIQTIFESNSSDGIIGNELLTEHVHPNIKGHFIIADALYKKISRMGLFDDWNKFIDTESAFNDIPVPKIDSLKGQYVVMDLKKSWPYDLSMSGGRPISVFYEIRDPDYDQRRALELYTQKLDWFEMMNQSYKRYTREHNYVQALRIAQSLILEYPYISENYQRACDMLTLMEDSTNASYYESKYKLLKH